MCDRALRQMSCVGQWRRSGTTSAARCRSTSSSSGWNASCRQSACTRPGRKGYAVGGAGAFPFVLTVPGGRVPRRRRDGTVAVLPTHRRRGVLRALMRAQLDDVPRARGVCRLPLGQSEDTIYSRFGYGIALPHGRDRPPARADGLPCRASSPAGTLASCRPAEAEALVAPVYEQVAAERPACSRGARRGGRPAPSPTPSGGAGAAASCNARSWSRRPVPRRTRSIASTPHSTGASRRARSRSSRRWATRPEATRAIWRFLLDIDWMARVQAGLLPLDHPLLLLLAEPRRLRLERPRRPLGAPGGRRGRAVRTLVRRPGAPSSSMSLTASAPGTRGGGV